MSERLATTWETINRMELRRLLAQRSLLTAKINAAAAIVARDWMMAHHVDEIRVDDENIQPHYARDYDDEMLDTAIGNLPLTLFISPVQPAWNPVVRLEGLTTFLSESS